jgi:hypothetical protein
VIGESRLILKTNPNRRRSSILSNGPAGCVPGPDCVLGHSRSQGNSRFNRNSRLNRNSRFNRNSRGDATVGSPAGVRQPGVFDGNGLQDQPLPIDRGIGTRLIRRTIPPQLDGLCQPWSPTTVAVSEEIGAAPLLDGMPDGGS